MGKLRVGLLGFEGVMALDLLFPEASARAEKCTIQILARLEWRQ